MTPKRHLHQGDQWAWMLDQPDAALEEYRKALELDPSFALAYWWIGQVHFFASPPRIEEALASFRDAVRVKPAWSEGHFWLGLGLASAGEHVQAVAELRKAVALSEREDERLFAALGISLSALGKHAEAAEAFENAAHAVPNEDAMYHLMRGDALHADDQQQQACAAWERALDLDIAGHTSMADSKFEARIRLARHCQPAQMKSHKKRKRQ